MNYRPIKLAPPKRKLDRKRDNSRHSDPIRNNLAAKTKVLRLGGNSPPGSGITPVLLTHATLAWPRLNPRVSKHLNARAIVLRVVVARVVTVLLQSYDRVAAGEEEFVKLAHDCCTVCCAALLLC